jgi:hypothetical protein
VDVRRRISSLGCACFVFRLRPSRKGRPLRYGRARRAERRLLISFNRWVITYRGRHMAMRSRWRRRGGLTIHVAFECRAGCIKRPSRWPTHVSYPLTTHAGAEAHPVAIQGDTGGAHRKSQQNSAPGTHDAFFLNPGGSVTPEVSRDQPCVAEAQADKLILQSLSRNHVESTQIGPAAVPPAGQSLARLIKQAHPSRRCACLA